MKEEGTVYLPDNATCIIQEMVNLRTSFDILARKNAVPRRKPIDGFSEPVAEVYPNNPIHTMENHYYADKIKDKDEDGGCNNHRRADTHHLYAQHYEGVYCPSLR